MHLYYNRAYAQTKRHERLQITAKMQHFMAKMQKKNYGEELTGRGHSLPIPHPLRRLTQNAFGVRAPLVTVL